MLINETGLLIESTESAINFTKDSKIIAQLIVKEFKLNNGKSGICLYSVIDKNEYFIRRDKPEVSIISDKGSPVVLIDCKAGKFNIAIKCDSNDSAIVLMNSLNVKVDILWAYRNQQLKEFIQLNSKNSNKKVNNINSNHNEVKESININIELASQLRKLKKLIRTGKFINGNFEELATVAGSNCVTALTEIYDKYKSTHDLNGNYLK